MKHDLSALQTQYRGLPASQEISNKLVKVDGHLNDMNANLAAEGPRRMMISKLTERLQTAMSELNDAQTKYTDIHPIVKAKKEVVESIQKQMSQTATNTSLSAALMKSLTSNLPTPTGANSSNPEMDIIRMKMLALEEANVNLISRQREAELYATTPPGMCRVLAPATLSGAKEGMRWLKIGLASCVGGGLGLGLTLGLIGLVELTSRRVV